MQLSGEDRAYIALGETAKFDFKFLMGEEAAHLFRNAGKFYQGRKICR